MIIVSLPYATFGLIDEEGVIIAAAPIAAHWVIGKSTSYVTDYYKRKGATVSILPENFWLCPEPPVTNEGQDVDQSPAPTDPEA